MRLAGSEEGPEISYGTGSNANFSVSGVTALIFFLLPAATARQPANWQMCGSSKCVSHWGGKGISVQSPRGLGVSQMIFSMICGSPFPGGSSPRIPRQLNVPGQRGRKAGSHVDDRLFLADTVHTVLTGKDSNPANTNRSTKAWIVVQINNSYHWLWWRLWMDAWAQLTPPFRHLHRLLCCSCSSRLSELGDYLLCFI